MTHLLTAIGDLTLARTREEAGRHEYDGLVQDLSPTGVKRDLDALVTADNPAVDPHDRAQLEAARHRLRVRFGELELHRRDPTLHLENLETFCYQRDYAEAGHRAEATRRHLDAWPQAVDAAIASLDRVPAPVAAAAIEPARSLASYVPDGDSRAAAALDRLVAHLEHLATDGDPEVAIGGAALARLAGADEAVDVDLTSLADRAETERETWWQHLTEACRRIDPNAPVADTMAALLDDHPSAAELLAETTSLVDQVIQWTNDRGLLPPVDGECSVRATPASQGFQVAAMYATAPHEPDAASWFCVTPPDPGWPEARQRDWLRNYHRSGLANIALHEVAPGHFAHARARRRADGDVRKTLNSTAFTEGWAHYIEQLALEEGYADGDPRFAASVARDALLRVTRLACVIGLQTGTMSLADAEDRYRRDTFCGPDTARAAVGRVLRDPTTMAYTWGKLAILDLRETAKQRWGNDFSLRRFHTALLDLGAPPIGLISDIL
ncbi:DUF885 family protein [Stackebrandtia nassauensis]|uniref:DUF885 domain-containing protein n=1 Tax=Stackebrandtia nassauensis (strain DSM 44728 / CIP 108903 / NRRL B-16338 / NBRC 102104 / LLR-40K-21) TaxID=446470 RepID=D3Q289_STANL|nr:DUF885 family protein [Stackebrandtia nassauensis]ADD43822.1 protein of unknown function DUF885 [Stackebrandtia nassauensis DSM 44728]